MIQQTLIDGFPYLKGMLLSGALALESQGSPRYRVFQRLKTLMEHYSDHFPVKMTQQREERAFWIQFNRVMGLDSTHLIIKNYLSIQPANAILLLRDYKGDNLMALLHKKSINDPGNREHYSLVLERIFQNNVPLILGLNYQRRLIVSGNIYYFCHIFPRINNNSESVATFMTLLAFSLACHQREISAVIKARLDRIFI